MMDCDALFKIVVIGDSAVGKTNLITRYTRDYFSASSKTTIGVEFASKTMDCDGVIVKGQIWDTAGQDRFRAIATAYYRGAHGALIVYDITNEQSFETLEGWFKEIEAITDTDCLNVLIGNKCDLALARTVSTQRGKEFAERHNIRFLETSAANSTNVDVAFTELLQEVYNRHKNHLGNSDQKPIVPGPNNHGLRIVDEDVNIDDSDEKRTKSFRCC